MRIWLGRRRCDDFYGIGGGRRTVSRPGRLDDAEKSSHLVLLLDHVEGFGGCRALVAPRTLPSATQARTCEVLSLTACTGKVRVPSNRQSTRQITLDRARRSLVTFDVKKKAPFSTSVVFRFSNTREYAANPLRREVHPFTWDGAVTHEQDGRCPRGDFSSDLIWRW